MRYIHREGCPWEGKTVRVLEGDVIPEQRIEILEHRLDPEVARKQNKAIVQTTVRCIECNSHEVYSAPKSDVLFALLSELEGDAGGAPERRAAKKEKESINAI